MNDEEAEQAVYWALEAGYRHIDSAEWYVHTASYLESQFMMWSFQV
jgi:diketogulonate reductase-like aldo/keto reductase